MNTAASQEQPPRWDPNDPLFRPLTIAQAMERTGRTRRTIDRWIHDGRLRTVRLDYPPQTVVVERDVLEVERATRRAAQSGRPRLSAGDTPSATEGVDAGS